MTPSTRFARHRSHNDPTRSALFPDHPLLQPPQKDPRVVLQFDAPVARRRIEQPPQRRQHGSVLRMPRRRRVGGRQQPALQRLEVQRLRVVEVAFGDEPFAKPPVHLRRIGVALHDRRVVDSKGVQQGLVPVEKRRAAHAPRIPEDRDPAARTQNPPPFRPHALGVEPVKRLRRRHEVHARRGQGRRLRPSAHGPKPRIPRQPFLRRGPHRRIGLDGRHAVARVEKQFRRDPRPRADIGDLPRRRQPGLFPQPGNQRRRIIRAIPHVVFDAITEALGGVHGDGKLE